ncbi:hypothetical protein F4778DRAFT_800235 [Xylariomycetidae sp. FL2044]|nr:hypothetical protein F4778DRAFT_800235 [Xylariomycetidae sp. FL2044]
MCHGHPHHHPCQHTSVKWLYCPEAVFDLETGYETPCSNPIYSTPQPTNVDCPLSNCHFSALRGSWTCCKCGSGPNTQGWCNALSQQVVYNPMTRNNELMELSCGHGCCSKCNRTPASGSASPEISFSDMRKGKVGRKSHGTSRSSTHKRNPTYDYGGKYSTTTTTTMTTEGSGKNTATSTSASSSAPSGTHSSRGSRKSGYDASYETGSKKTKSTSSKIKSHKSRHHH